MLRFQTTLLTVFLMLGLVATATAQSDPKATEVLNRTRSKVDKLQDMTVTFRKSMKMNSGRSLGNGYTGKLMSKGKRYRISVQNQTVISNGLYQWAINDLDEEVIISRIEEDQNFTPDRLFRLSQDDMRSKYHGLEGGLHKIEMIPNKRENYFKTYLWIGTKDLPQKMAVYNRNGSIITYDVKDIQYNTGLSDSKFTFDKAKYSDYYIEDMRD